MLAEVLHVPLKEQRLVDREGRINDRYLDMLQLLGRTYGLWKNVAYLASMFSANGAMTWTVESGDLITFAYCLMGKRLDIEIVIRGAAVGGVANTTLQVTLPAGLVAGRDATCVVRVNDNGTIGPGWAKVTAGSSTISILKQDESNWTAGANGVEGIVSLEVQ